MAESKNSGGAPPPRWILKLVTRAHVLMNVCCGGRSGVGAEPDNERTTTVRARVRDDPQ